jgi:hypothetical protein
VQGVIANLIGGRRQVVNNLCCAVDLGFGEYRGTQDVVEVLVCQHDMRDRASSEPPNVGGDSRGFDERGTGVDKQCSRTAVHQPDRDIAKRQPTAVHIVETLA